MPPGATRSMLTDTSAEAVPLEESALKLRLTSGAPLTLRTAIRGACSPDLRNLMVKEAVSCPSPPRVTYTPSEAVVAPSRAFNEVVAVSAVASQGR